MKIYYDLKQVSKLKDSFVFFDTNTFIGAFIYPDLFNQLFNDLKKEGCAFLTISSVAFEFTRGTRTIEEFNDKAEFLKTLASTYPIEKDNYKFKELTIILQKVKGEISYTDFLLIACLHKFVANSYLLSSNHKDCPTELLDRECVITVDTEKDLKNYGLYKFSEHKFNRIAENILKAKI